MNKTTKKYIPHGRNKKIKQAGEKLVVHQTESAKTHSRRKKDGTR